MSISLILQGKKEGLKAEFRIQGLFFATDFHRLRIEFSQRQVLS